MDVLSRRIGAPSGSEYKKIPQVRIVERRGGYSNATITRAGVGLYIPTTLIHRERKVYVMQKTAYQHRTMPRSQRVVIPERLHVDTVGSGPSGPTAAAILIRGVGRSKSLSAKFND